MGTKLTPDTKPTTEIFFDDNGVILGGFDGADLDADAAMAVWTQNQDKNIALARLQALGIWDGTAETAGQFWEMKADVVNIKVPADKKQKVLDLVAGFAVTVNG